MIKKYIVCSMFSLFVASGVWLGSATAQPRKIIGDSGKVTEIKGNVVTLQDATGVSRRFGLESAAGIHLGDMAICQEDCGGLQIGDKLIKVVTITCQLTVQQASGLVPAIVLDEPPDPNPTRQRSLNRLRLLSTQPLPTSRQPFFLVQGEWSFTAARRFQQADKSGNRLVLRADGTAEAFNSSGALMGSIKDPALAKVYAALLRLTK